MRKRTQARECALQILYQYEINPQSVEEVAESFWIRFPDTPEQVRQFSEYLVRGVVEHLTEIDPSIEKYAQNWQLKRMAAIDRNILRLSVFEIIYSGEIPPKVSINEAVNMAKKFSQQDSGKFVNGILDRISHAAQKLNSKKS